MVKRSQPIYKSRIRALLKAKNEFMRNADSRFEDFRIEDVANTIGVSRQTMQAWMSDAGVRQTPRPEHQRALEVFFGVPWTSIWYIEDSDDKDEGQPAGV